MLGFLDEGNSGEVVLSSFRILEGRSEMSSSAMVMSEKFSGDNWCGKE